MMVQGIWFVMGDWIWIGAVPDVASVAVAVVVIVIDTKTGCC